LLVIWLLAWGAPTATAATLMIDSSGKLTGAMDVSVGFVLYDVKFVDGTCVALFSGCNEPVDFTFHSSSAAQVASQALLGQVFLNVPDGPFDLDARLTFGCESANCFALTPWLPLPPNLAAIALAQNSFTIDQTSLGTVGIAFDTTAPIPSNPGVPSFVYAVWSPSEPDTEPPTVPEPATLTLVGVGLAVARLARRSEFRGGLSK
jgi:hypothetical protein